MARKRHLLSYLAGILDGEGCVSIYRDTPRGKRINPHHSVRVTVSMQDGIVPFLFRNTFGGSLIQDKKAIIWQIGGHKSLPVLEELLPYSLIKRPQMEVAISFLRKNDGSKCGRRGLGKDVLVLREADYILCKKLKQERITPVIDKGVI